MVVSAQWLEKQCWHFRLNLWPLSWWRVWSVSSTFNKRKNNNSDCFSYLAKQKLGQLAWSDCNPVCIIKKTTAKHAAVETAWLLAIKSAIFSTLTGCLWKGAGQSKIPRSFNRRDNIWTNVKHFRYLYILLLDTYINVLQMYVVFYVVLFVVLCAVKLEKTPGQRHRCNNDVLYGFISVLSCQPAVSAPPSSVLFRSLDILARHCAWWDKGIKSVEDKEKNTNTTMP